MMVTLHTAVDEADWELSALEDTTQERRLVDALLEISEENYLNESEPDEYHCYAGREHAVCGWARVAPLSCILVTSNTHKRPKQAKSATPSSDDRRPSKAASSARIAEQHCESDVGPDKLKKSVSVNQQTRSWSKSATAAQQTDATECPVLNTMQRKKAPLLLEEKVDERGTHTETLSQLHRPSSKYSVPENRPAKPRKCHHRPNNRLVPIKNMTFLPPIKSPHLISNASGYLYTGKKTPEGETSEKNCFIFEKSHGTRVDTNLGLSTFSPALTSKYQTYWQNSQCFNTKTY